MRRLQIMLRDNVFDGEDPMKYSPSWANYHVSVKLSKSQKDKLI